MQLKAWDVIQRTTIGLAALTQILVALMRETVTVMLTVLETWFVELTTVLQDLDLWIAAWVELISIFWLCQELKKSQCLSVPHGDKLSRALNYFIFLSYVCLRSLLGRSQVSFLGLSLLTSSEKQSLKYFALFIFGSDRSLVNANLCFLFQTILHGQLEPRKCCLVDQMADIFNTHTLL